MSQGEQKLVFLDIDGTLINDRQQLPPSALSACRSAIARGHQLFLCTGRTVPELYPWLLELGFSGILAANGSYGQLGEQVLFEHFLPAEQVAAIDRQLADMALAWAWQSNLATYPRGQFLELFQFGEHKQVGQIQGDWSEFVKQLQPYLRPGQLGPTSKGIVLVEAGKVLELEHLAQQSEQSIQLIRGPITAHQACSFELIPQGINKGTGIKRVCEQLGCTLAQTIAIGDGWNDIEMLSEAGIGVAMGNALPEVARYADWQTTRVDEDGIARAFTRLGLI